MNAYAFALMKLNGRHGRAFFVLLLVTPLEQWGVAEWDIAHVTLDYLNIISPNFQSNPYSHLAGCRTHIHINIYI